MSLKVRDRGAAMERFNAALRELEAPPPVTVGVHWEEGVQEHRGPSEGVDVIDVANILEFGGENRAPSAFLRSTIDARRSELERLLANAGQRALKSAMYGTSSSGHVTRALGRVAARSERIIRRELKKLGLVDTEHLIESIRGKVGGKPAIEREEST